MNKYILTEGQLFSLLEDKITLQCLDTDGVGSWSWYMKSKNSIIAEILKIPIEEVIRQDLTFRDAAQKELNQYPKIEEKIKED